MHFLSVGREEFSRFLCYQDDVADATEDFAVVALLRKTSFPEELHDEFKKFIHQIIAISENLMLLAEKLSLSAEKGFSPGGESPGPVELGFVPEPIACSFSIRSSIYYRFRKLRPPIRKLRVDPPTRTANLRSKC